MEGGGRWGVVSRKAGKSIEDQKWWSWRERDTLEPVSMPCGIGGTFGLVVLTFTCCPFTSSSEGLTCERWWVCRALKVVEEVQPIPKRHMSPGRGNSNDLSESSQENVSTSTAQSRQALRLLLFFFFFFLAMLHGMQDLSSQTSNRTHVPCRGNKES